MAKKQTFALGDRVAYSATWLRSTGNRTGPLGHLRGTVERVQKFGDNQLVVIAWDGYRCNSEYHDDGLGRVIAPNLTLVSRIAVDAALAEG